eukprot:TRINITY_DN628_c0_g4_i1.p1 TRINITY_DN628_c0_g4~~TRINITY_DN628_c0_g4_i1.p1  ORF type:complete len:341 (-),score=126.47 TRINITY_DN628_c0_g4_i1:79-1101(-)
MSKNLPNNQQVPPNYRSNTLNYGPITNPYSYQTGNPNANYAQYQYTVPNNHTQPTIPNPPNNSEGRMANEHVSQLVQELLTIDKREAALLELSKKREQIITLGQVLWSSFGTMTVLLQEITSIYPLLYPPKLKSHASNRVCNALALLQSVAGNSGTRIKFLEAEIPNYLFPLLQTNSKNRPFEYLRLTSLGVIGALIKNEDEFVVKYLVGTNITLICIKIIETGTDISKTVATFIIQKLLQTKDGVVHICENQNLLKELLRVLQTVLPSDNSSSGGLIKHVSRCYLKLLANTPPGTVIIHESLASGSIASRVGSDQSAVRALFQLQSEYNKIMSTKLIQN